MASQATAGGAGGGAGASSTKGISNNNNSSNGSSDTASFGEVDESMVLDPASGFYNRSACADGNAVCSYLAKRYKHSVECFLTPSGMSAISCIAQSAFSKPKWRNAGLIIHSSELYCDSPKVFAFLEQSLGIQRIPFNTLEADKVSAPTTKHASAGPLAGPLAGDLLTNHDGMIVPASTTSWKLHWHPSSSGPSERCCSWRHAAIQRASSWTGISSPSCASWWAS